MNRMKGKIKNNGDDDKFWGNLELTVLSLAPTVVETEYSQRSACKKRKSYHLFKSHDRNHQVDLRQTSTVDLQFQNPLPFDWEQCLDLQSGRMYYVNKKTQRRSWDFPKQQNQDLDPNISSSASNSHRTNKIFQSDSKNNAWRPFSPKSTSYSISSTNIMSNTVALPCSNCHLLVMLSISSPSCPNCKYVHSLSTLELNLHVQPQLKPLDTLSLLY